MKLKVFKGDWKALKALLLAMIDLLFSIPNIVKKCNRLTNVEYEAYQNLETARLYWNPEDENTI